MEFLARAVDLGYGYVKYSKGHLSASGDLPCDAFPSTAPQSYGHNDVDGGVMRGLDVVPVEIDGQTYHVGPQSLVAAPGLFSRMLDDSYFTSPQYLALFRGALHYMGLPGRQVDSMVVGLPIKQYRNPAVIAHVQRQFSGTHVLPRRSMSLPERHVGITWVRVVPQTVGALVAQSQAVGAADRVPHETNLTIDVGYGTLQWMLSQGTTPVPARCGCTMGGVSVLLQTMISSVDRSLTADPHMLDRFDKGLMDPAFVVKVDGKCVDMAPFRSGMRAMLGEHVATMMRSVGRTSDVDNIFLCGGGAPRYLSLIQEAFPNHAVHAAAPAVSRFANLRGFQVLSELRCRLVPA